MTPLLRAERLVKHFKNEADGQERILCAFHRAHWRECVDFFMAATSTATGKKRLRDTVRNLSQYLRVPAETTAAATGGRAHADDSVNCPRAVTADWLSPGSSGSPSATLPASGIAARTPAASAASSRACSRTSRCAVRSRS